MMINTTVKIKNISENDIKCHIYTLKPNEEIVCDYNDLYSIVNNFCINEGINSNILEVHFNDTLIKKNTFIYCLKNEFPFSAALDLNNIDQEVDGTNWIEVLPKRIIWDINQNYDIVNNDFVVPVDGIYYADGQFNVKNIQYCESIELAIFKREENGDDFWFILDKKIINNQSEEQMTFNTLFDFYENEKYAIKIKLTKKTNLLNFDPSCKINGSDDYTAWGYSFSKSLYN